MARHEAEALWALAADELEAEARARVEAHVAACEACARELARVRLSREVLSASRPEVPSVRWAQVDERVLGSAARHFARVERPARGPWALALAGACAAGLAFVLLRPVAAPVPPPAPEPLAVRGEPPPPPAAEPASIQVESATGALSLQEGGEQVLQPGMPLRPGTAVRTPASASALLRLPDASRVRVAPGSEVVLSLAEAADVHLTVKSGRLAVQASHAERRGFVVEAQGLRVFVVGTVFSVEHAEHGGSSVAVLEGQVRVEAEGQPPRFVSAGERVEWREGEPTPRPRPLSAQDRQSFQSLGLRAAPRAPVPPRSATGITGARTVPARAVFPEVSAPSGVLVGQGSVAESTVVEARAGVSPSPASVGDVATPPRESSASPSSGSAPRASDERLLQHVQSRLGSTTCEAFLAGLADIALYSTVRDYREQAVYLRARCFEERRAQDAALAEFRRYLREFPHGRYVNEARAALLP